MNPISIRSIAIFRLAVALAIWMTGSTIFVSAQELKWQTDLEQAIQLAEKEQKLILLHFTATWSKSCQDLQAFVYSSTQVQRAIDANVIPVQIDVDEQVELTSQYGIGKVPYDIVITPSKRIIARRESPKEASAYNLMIVRLEKTIQQMAEQGSSTLDQNLDDFQALMQKADPIRQHEPLTPQRPNHAGAAASQDSQEMNRKFVANPAYEAKIAAERAAENAAPEKTAAQTSGNASTPVAPPKASSPGPLKIINPNFFADNGAGTARQLTNATMQPNLQRPPVFIEPSVHDSRPQTIDKAKFVGNPTALATEFKADVTAEKLLPAQLAASLAGPIESPSASPSAGSPKAVLSSDILNGSVSNSASPVATAEVKTPEKQVDELLREPSQSSASASVGLQGKCPVTLIREGRWVAGSKQWGCIHRDQTYLFASQENLTTFLADPDAYSPLLAGFDPVIFDRTGKLVPGLEEHGVFMGKAPNLRVVLFSDKETRREFESNPKKYVLTIRQAMENSGGGSSPVEH